MNSPTHDQIAQRAHQLWLDQGCPEGRSDEHWRDAERMLRNARPSDSPADATLEPEKPARPAPLVAANNQSHPVGEKSAAPTLKAAAAAESADENLMSPPPTDDAAIRAALPGTGASSSGQSRPSASTHAPASGKHSAPLVAGKNGK